MSAPRKTVRHSEHIEQLIYEGNYVVFCVTNLHPKLSNLWTKKYLLPMPPLGLDHERLVVTTYQVDSEKHLLLFQDTYAVRLNIDVCAGRAEIRFGRLVLREYETLGSLVRDLNASLRQPFPGHLATTLYVKCIGTGLDVGTRRKALFEEAFPDGGNQSSGKSEIRTILVEALVGRFDQSVIQKTAALRDLALQNGLEYTDEYSLLLQFLAKASAKAQENGHALEYAKEWANLIRDKMGEQSDTYVKALGFVAEMCRASGDFGLAERIRLRQSTLAIITSAVKKRRDDEQQAYERFRMNSR